jgi:hypothetical protein
MKVKPTSASQNFFVELKLEVEIVEIVVWSSLKAFIYWTKIPLPHPRMLLKMLVVSAYPFVRRKCLIFILWKLQAFFLCKLEKGRKGLRADFISLKKT